MSLTQKELEWHRKNYGKYLLKELSDEIYSITDDPRKSILDIANKLQEAKPYLEAKDYLKFRMDLHKLTHGEKININKVSVNIDMSLQSDEKEDLLQLLNDTRKVKKISR
jgi:hypothetical protein